MTSSSGTIGCVPEGTPNSNPPVVKKEKETKTNADGTTATTETTTTRDPSTGVEQKTSTTTTKDANGNTTGVTSSSGTSGTTSGGNPEKPGDSDFCQKNPKLDICTGKRRLAYNLGGLVKSFEIKKGKAHQAEEDTRMTADLLEKQILGVQEVVREKFGDCYKGG